MTMNKMQDNLNDNNIMDDDEALASQACAFDYLASAPAPPPSCFEIDDDDSDESDENKVHYSDNANEINYNDNDECEIIDDSPILVRRKSTTSGYTDFLSDIFVSNMENDNDHNIHRVISSRDDYNRAEAAHSLRQYRSRSILNRLRWDIIALMAICLVVGIAIGVPLSQDKNGDITQEETTAVIGLGLDPQETIDDHLDDGGLNNEDLPQQLPETEIVVGEIITVAAEIMAMSQVSTANTASMPDAGMNPQKTLNQYQPSGGNIDTAEDASTPQQTSETKTAVTASEGSVVSVTATTEVATNNEMESTHEINFSASVNEDYGTQKFDRSMGWDGNSYIESIEFCAKQDSYTLCPYDAICPGGPGSRPHGGMHDAWVAMIEFPNGWVQTAHGNNTTDTNCMEYHTIHEQPPPWYSTANNVAVNGDIMPYILCCKEPIHDDEEDDPKPSPIEVESTAYAHILLDESHPVWFGRKEGYHGKSHLDAATFCESVGDMALCSINVYCPSGLAAYAETAPTKLLFNKDPFESEQWAPVMPTFDKSNVWVSVGTDPAICFTYEELYHKQPVWGMDGSKQWLKEHILCCQNQDHSQKEKTVQEQFDPFWIDSSQGSWGQNGWSHEDAMEVCEQHHSSTKLCPYEAYCPNGEGHSVMGGNYAHHVAEDELWAPINDGDEHLWVQIGQKYQNRATKCMKSSELPMPDWNDATIDEANLKKYILCCEH